MLKSPAPRLTSWAAAPAIAGLLLAAAVTGVAAEDYTDSEYTEAACRKVMAREQERLNDCQTAREMQRQSRDLWAEIERTEAARQAVQQQRRDLKCAYEGRVEHAEACENLTRSYLSHGRTVEGLEEKYHAMQGQALSLCRPMSLTVIDCQRAAQQRTKRTPRASSPTSKPPPFDVGLPPQDVFGPQPPGAGGTFPPPATLVPTPPPRIGGGRPPGSRRPPGGATPPNHTHPPSASGTPPDQTQPPASGSAPPKTASRPPLPKCSNPQCKMEGARYNPNLNEWIGGVCVCPKSVFQYKSLPRPTTLGPPGRPVTGPAGHDAPRRDAVAPRGERSPRADGHREGARSSRTTAGRRGRVGPSRTSTRRTGARSSRTSAGRTGARSTRTSARRGRAKTSRTTARRGRVASPRTSARRSGVRSPRTSASRGRARSRSSVRRNAVRSPRARAPRRTVRTPRQRTRTPRSDRRSYR